MRIAVVGSGYVGLVSGACFADFGHSVVCVDLDAAKIDRLKSGQIPIYEPGLAPLVARNAESGGLSFTTDLGVAVRQADVVFIAVGTPSRRGDGHADLSFVKAAARDIARAAEGLTVVVLKSTVPVGTGDEVENVIREERPKAEILVVSNPEFLREGAAIEDFKRPDRIVVGTDDERAIEIMREVYRPLFLNQSPILFVSRRTAELTKYAANAFLAMKITFINEIADLCEVTGADVQDVARGIGLDKRIGPKFLNAGPGYGGSCFPKDTLALVKTAQDFDRPLRLIETTVSINDSRKRSMARKVIAACGGNVRGKRIALLGLAFKPNTDDVRYSPALTIIQTLLDHGALLACYDPQAIEGTKELFPDLRYGTDPYDIAEDADALVLITEWDAFRALDFVRLRQVMREPTLVDLRNVYRQDAVVREGFSYWSIGRADDSDPGSALDDPARAQQPDALIAGNVSV
jgi:UDPglucose 6-dehydrogenase